MHVTLFMAMSVNGMIARQDGSEDFLSDEHWKTFSSFVADFGNFIVGQKTYEAVKGWEESYGFDDFPDAKKVVVSNNPQYALDEGYILASSPQGAITILEKEGFERALLAGGSTLNASFAQAGSIDEIILNIEPTVVGKGIPLFGPEDFQLKLQLMESRNITDDILQLQYRVEQK